MCIRGRLRCTALTLFVMISSFGLTSCSHPTGAARPATTPAGALPASTAPSPTANGLARLGQPASRPLPAGARTVSVGTESDYAPDASGPVVLAASGDAIWANGGPFRFDLRTGRAGSALAPGYESAAVAADADGAWSTDSTLGVVRRFDERTGRLVATVELSGSDTLPDGIAVTGDGVWVACHHAGTVVRIDPHTNKVVATIRLTSPGVFGPSAVVAAGDSIWVTIPKGNQVVRLDARTGRIVTRVPLGDAMTPCEGLAVTSTVVWVLDCSTPTNLARIDVRTGRLTTVRALGYTASRLVADGDNVWLDESTGQPSGAGYLVEITSAGRAVARYALGPGFGAGGITIGSGAIWAANSAAPRIVRVPLPT